MSEYVVFFVGRNGTPVARTTDRKISFPARGKWSCLPRAGEAWEIEISHAAEKVNFLRPINGPFFALTHVIFKGWGRWALKALGEPDVVWQDGTTFDNSHNATYSGVWTSLPYAEAKARRDAVRRAEEEAVQKAAEEEAVQKAAEEEARYFAPMKKLLEMPEIKALRQEFLKKCEEKSGKTIEERIVFDAGIEKYSIRGKKIHFSWVNIIGGYIGSKDAWSKITLYYVSEDNRGIKKLFTFQELEVLEKELGLGTK